MPGAAAGAKREAEPHCTNVGFWKGRSTVGYWTKVLVFLTITSPSSYEAMIPVDERRLTPPAAAVDAAHNDVTPTLPPPLLLSCWTSEMPQKPLPKQNHHSWIRLNTTDNTNDVTTLSLKASDAPCMSIPIHKFKNNWHQTLNTCFLHELQSPSSVSNCEKQCSIRADIYTKPKMSVLGCTTAWFVVANLIILQ